MSRRCAGHADDSEPVATTPYAAIVATLALTLTPLLSACGGGGGGPTDPDPPEPTLSFEPIQGEWEGSGTFGEDDLPVTVETFELGGEASVGDSIGHSVWQTGPTSCEAELLAMDAEANTYLVQVTSADCTGAGGALDEGEEIDLNHRPDSDLLNFKSDNSSGTLERK